MMTSTTRTTGGVASLYRCVVTLLVGVVIGRFLSGPLFSFEVNDFNNNGNGLTGVDASTTSTKLADGCFHVFMDVGANIGVHGRFLLEPHKFPNAKDALKFFQNQFGPPATRDNGDICVFAFEPNPNHHERLYQVSAAYKAMGWRFHVIPAGVSDKADQLEFYTNGDKSHSEWGFSAIHMDQWKDVLHATKTKIPVIRLAAWIQQHVEGRQFPAQVHGKYPMDSNATLPQPQVVMKMDIEGMEYRVLPDLLLSGVFCNTLRAIFGEVHTEFFPQTLANGAVLEEKVGIAYWEHLTRAWQVNPSCTGKFIVGDDENYLLDGVPLPEPKNDAEQT